MGKQGWDLFPSLLWEATVVIHPSAPHGSHLACFSVLQRPAPVDSKSFPPHHLWKPACLKFSGLFLQPSRRLEPWDPRHTPCLPALQNQQPWETPFPSSPFLPSQSLPLPQSPSTDRSLSIWSPVQVRSFYKPGKLCLRLWNTKLLEVSRSAPGIIKRSRGERRSR